MRRSPLLLLALTAAALAGCGNKGPLTLPATRPKAAPPAAPASPVGAVPSASVGRPEPSRP